MLILANLPSLPSSWPQRVKVKYSIDVVGRCTDIALHTCSSLVAELEESILTLYLHHLKIRGRQEPTDEGQCEILLSMVPSFLPWHHRVLCGSCWRAHRSNVPW